ncbi:CLCA_X family protein [Marinomonas sp. THO17]|uniref:CLCA_X family protein n=1 Tax=Marinomonas sp. THO17 TaxID=3149048 RepID=UPI00336BC0FA
MNYSVHNEISFVEIRRQFDFRGIEIGSWVTPEERDQAALHFHRALVDLMGVLQGPESLISLRGSLGLQYGKGGQPGVAAHYTPSTRQLALAKNAGAGSLAHEWFHAFDHYMADKLYPQTPSMSFASNVWLNTSDTENFRHHPLNIALIACFKAIMLNLSGSEPSELFRASQKADQEYNILYYAKPEELCARSFEAFVEDACPTNPFLVRGTRYSIDTQRGLYPQGEQRERIGNAFRHYFYTLGASLFMENGN